MKQKLLALLKPKFASKGFSQKTIEGLADILVKNLTDESTDEEVNTAIDGVTPFAEIMQAENTRYANEVKSKLPKPVEETKKADDVVIDPNETAQDNLLRQILEQNKALFWEIANIKGEKVTNTRKEQLAKALEGTSEVYRNSKLEDFEYASFKDDESFNSYIEKTRTHAAGFIQDETNKGLGGDKVANGTIAPISGAKASDKELDAVMENL